MPRCFHSNLHRKCSLLNQKHDKYIENRVLYDSAGRTVMPCSMLSVVSAFHDLSVEPLRPVDEFVARCHWHAIKQGSMPNVKMQCLKRHC